MKDITLVTKKNKDGNEYKIVNRYLKSLEEYRLPMYEKYSDEEINYYKPLKI